MLVRLYLKTSSQIVERGVDRLNSDIVGVDRAQPRLLPIDSAPVLASVVTAAIAAWAVQDHHVICRKPSDRVTVDAGFVDPSLDAKHFSTPVKHFRHKRKTIEGAVIVKRKEYFICRSNYYALSDKEPSLIHRRLAIASERALIAV
jgi:hypothetical protein